MNRADLVKQRKRRELRIQRSLVQSASVMRSVDYTKPSRAVIATETPIPKYDDQTDQVVREVLLMSGAEFRSGRNQIPIVDSHDDRTVRNIFGSIQNIRIDYASGEMYGTPVFASDPESQSIATRMNEGHITDFSITAIPTETIFVARGQSYTTDRGELIDGPALVHTKWTPLNASICATGADENSTVRRSYTDLNRKVSRMDEALVAELSAMGLPEGMTDPNQVLAWVVGKMKDSKEPEYEMPEAVENMAGEEPAMPEEPKPEVVENMDGEKKPEEMVARQLVVSQIKRALEADKKRRKEILAACTLAKVERAIADEWCESGISVSEARKRIIERMATVPLGTSVGADVRVTGDGQERMMQAVKDGLVKRSLSAARVKSMKVDNKDADDFKHISMSRAAELVCRSMGVNTDVMTKQDIARLALGNRRLLEKHRVERAYHTTGSFPNILLDAANKTLLAAYEEAEATWNLWARQAPSVEDFKNINRIRFSESPNPEMVPEKQPYKEKSVSDSKESYKVEKYGAMFTVSWETVVNDDLDAISRVPAMHGVACRRLVNQEVYSVLTANAAMADTIALFNASHSNLSGSNGNPTVTNLNTAFAAMMKQTGLGGSLIRVVPRFLIVPVALSATAEELISSISYNAANNNEGVKNIYGPGGSRPLTVISEPLLDGNSATAWYLAADPSTIDTVEVTFLQGEESPVLEDEWGFDNDTYKYKVRQTFGTKAIDWRGLYKFST